MSVTVVINDVEIEAENFLKELVPDQTGKRQLQKISFTFDVKSSEYHDITTLLYKNDFIVRVPQLGIEFNGEIANYSTTITNLYKDEAVGKFSLELIEKSS